MTNDAWAKVLPALAIFLAGPFALYLLPKVSSQLAKALLSSVDSERRRLRVEVLGEAEGAGEDSSSRADHPGQPEPEEQAETHFAKLLIEYYAYGLTQARRSFAVSLTCSIVGGAILLAGIGAAIFKANSTGDQYASVTASVAGLAMTVIGTLFHRRADMALKHMESQTQSLRQDMKVERDAGQAVQLLGEVKDPLLQARLQAALILKFSGAELPDITADYRTHQGMLADLIKHMTGVNGDADTGVIPSEIVGPDEPTNT
ncbi:TRADD-N-associated membrane domain-containing protein [Streptomyces cylindrosporus]|uniref:Cyanobacterial TRADD-N associated 2 transmembrane domain-containing protein n=1 Tax=Streptomyces cylindrosporus TaxID=2927583 RepID=A0ABS9YIB1_9ACTN|nr:hypothetical protein [Streptomyces cylindrosporus]MCI3276980.1 hypothetical protein [Streptomyces cylindrosporus]